MSRPGMTAELRAAADSAQSACAGRTNYGAAILGPPRRAPDRASWKIQVYVITPVSRQVYDLLLAQVGGTWTVLGREELLSVSS